MSAQVPLEAKLLGSPLACRTQPTCGNWVLLPIFFTFTVFVGTLRVIGDVNSPYLSLGTVCCVALFCLSMLHIFSLQRILGSTGWFVMASAMAARLSIGIIHYLTLIDPNYLSNPSEYRFVHDFEFMHNGMRWMAEHWERHGFFSSLPEAYVANNKNPYLYAFAGLAYWASGVYTMNVAVWNIFYTLCTAAIVSHLAVLAGANRNHALVAYILTCFEPFGLISTLVWRDSLGQLCLAIGFYAMIVSTQRLIIFVFAVSGASLLAAQHRAPYLLLFAALGGYMLLLRKTRNRIVVVAVLLAFVVFFPLIWMYVLPRFQDNLLEHYGGLSEVSGVRLIYQLPARILRGLLGPFPWTQIATAEVPEYLVPEFAQHIFLVVTIWLTWDVVRKAKHHGMYLYPGIWCFVGLFLMGCIATGIHSAYTAVGWIFLLPLACQTSGVRWIRLLAFSTVVFALMNIFYVAAGLEGSGLSNIK